jgi:hypothetical protein
MIIQTDNVDVSSFSFHRNENGFIFQIGFDDINTAKNWTGDGYPSEGPGHQGNILG